MSVTFFERLRTNYSTMSPAYMRMAKYIAENYVEVAFMAANQVATKCETHESVVVKFAVSLGYSGYPELLRDVQEAAKGSMDPTRNEDEDSDYLRYHAMMVSVGESLSLVAGTPVPDAFKRMIEAASDAKHIHVLGFHTDALFVNMIVFYLDSLGYRVTPITDSGVGMYERLRKVGPGDLLVAVNFPPYLTRVREALRIAGKLGALTAIFTDREFSPAVKGADLIMALNLSDNRPIVVRTVVTSVISAWVTALAVKDRERTLASMDELDQLLAQSEGLIP